MSDVHQWRLRMSHAATRPSISVSDPGEQNVKVEKSETASSRAAPRLRLKPKLSSYFHQSAVSHPPVSHLPSAESRLADIFSCDKPDWTFFGPTFPPRDGRPDIEQVMNRLSRILFRDPLRGLQPSDNNAMLTLIEAHRGLLKEHGELQDTFQAQNEQKFACEVALQNEREAWHMERESLKNEVKRLEVLISKGHKGVVGVLEARQNSVLRKRDEGYDAEHGGHRDTRETINEFLKRTRREDKLARKDQRAIARPRAASPSASMAALSHKMSITSVHDDLPFGTPPSSILASTIHEESMMEAMGRQPSFTASSSAYSTFSSIGDPLPDELGDVTIHAVPINDSPEEASPKAEGRPGTQSNRSTITVIGLHDHNAGLRRRFSFYPGDDSYFGSVPSDTVSIDKAQPALRRSQSAANALDTITIDSTKTESGSVQSPGSMTPLGPSAVSPSLIPSPVSMSPMARPRRDDSLTKHLSAWKQQRTSVSNETISHSSSASEQSSLAYEKPFRLSAEVILPMSRVVDGKSCGQPHAAKTSDNPRTKSMAAAAAARAVSNVSK